MKKILFLIKTKGKTSKEATQEVMETLVEQGILKKEKLENKDDVIENK